MKRVALAVALVLLASLPWWVGNSYYINVATQMLIYAILALGLNVLVGYAGLVTLGHAGLFGIAAYAGATLVNSGHGHVVVTIGALAATLAVTAVFAVLALRGTGLGFVMITVALGQIVWDALPLDQPDQRRQRRLDQRDPARSVFRCQSADASYLGDAGGVPDRGRRDGDLVAPPSVLHCAARATSHDALTALGYNVWLTASSPSCSPASERCRGAAVSLL